MSSEGFDPGLFEELTRSLEPLHGQERQRLYEHYGLLDEWIHGTHLPIHNDHEFLMVNFVPGSEYEWMGFERRRPDWVQITCHGRREQGFVFDEGSDGTPASYVHVQSTMGRSKEVASEEVALVMTAVIEEALEALRTGRAVGIVADGIQE